MKTLLQHCKNYVLLASFLLLSYSLPFLNAQSHSVVKICDVDPKLRILNFRGGSSLSKYFSSKPTSQILVVAEGDVNYQAWLGTKYLGLFPKKIGIAPKLDEVGNLFLPSLINGKSYIAVNGKEYGPFNELKKVYFENNRLVINHINKDTYFWNIGTDTIFQGTFYSIFHPDKNGGYWAATPKTPEPNFRDIIINGKTVEYKKCIPNSDASQDKWFMYFYENEGPRFNSKRNNETPLYYYFSGKKGGPIQGYWASVIDDNGNIIGRHQLDSLWYIQFNQELHGPFSKIPNELTLQTNNKDCIVTCHSLNENKGYDLYFNWKKVGTFDKVNILGTKGEKLCYAYQDKNLYKLGYNGREIAQANSEIKEAFFSGDHLVYNDAYNIYIKGKANKTYSETWNLLLTKAGKPIFLYQNSAGYGIHINDKDVFYDKNVRPHLIMDNSLKHYLVYNPYEGKEILIDGQRFKFIEDKTEIYFNKIENKFHWLQLDGQEMFWHTYSLD